MVCLITGSLGFIGSHLTDRLISLGHKVVGFDNLSTGSYDNQNNLATTIIGDINDRGLLDELFAEYKFNVVFHLAAQNNLRKSLSSPRQDAETNVLGSLNLIEKCVEANTKFIFSSTGGAIYGENEPLHWNEETKANPKSPYGLGKLTVEKYLEIYKNVAGLKSTVLRYSNVCGSRQSITSSYSGVISLFIKRALMDDDLVVYGDGFQSRDFVSVGKVVEANILAMEKGLEGTYNVSSNSSHTVNEIAEMVLKLVPNSKSKIVYQDAFNGEVSHTKLSGDKLRSEGWSGDFDLMKEMGDVVEWQRSCVK